MRVLGLQTFIWQNNARSLFLLCIFPLIIAFLGYLIVFSFLVSDGYLAKDALSLSLDVIVSGSFYILGGVLIWFLIAWKFHTAMILHMTGATPIMRKDNPELYTTVENLCISRGLPTPKLYIIEDNSMNAFASGLSPDKSLIAFSKGLLEHLNPKEVEAVAAHELTHIINRDSRLMVISIIFVGIIQTMAEFFIRIRLENKNGGKDSGNAVLVILAIKAVVFLIGFFFTLIIQMAISRKREFMADAGAVELTKTGSHLISALEKISTDSRIEVIHNRNVAQLCIENPLDKSHFFDTLLSSHPPISERIRILRGLG